jgi:hypothetical protein
MSSNEATGLKTTLTKEMQHQTTGITHNLRDFSGQTKSSSYSQTTPFEKGTIVANLATIQRLWEMKFLNPKPPIIQMTHNIKQLHKLWRGKKNV